MKFGVGIELLKLGDGYMRFMILFGLLCACLKFPITKCFSRSFMARIMTIPGRSYKSVQREMIWQTSSLTDNILLTLVN